ncbi:MAG: DMT family transporter [Rhodospirillaceae bacterium]|nr:DMT family transporter [Rhodospirillaceae bacterium]MBT4589557.1 DMT family transporter [Rhodospirillaceae bacterium]MBT4939000.1 DMT family transporter [Rhodospirillaceae bacterium]MBT7265557.1 DMT family transporter [Rhodospirillaceae bacterium]
MTQGSSQGLSRSGYLLLIGVIIGWGTSWPFLKIGLNEIPPWTYRGLVAPTAALFIFSVGFFLRQNMWVPKGQWKSLLTAALFNVMIWHIFSAGGIPLLGSGQAAIIAYTMPLWAVVFSMSMGSERPSLQRLLGLGLGLVGLATLTIGEFGIFTTSPMGTILMLIAAMSWGIGTAVQKRVQWQMPAMAVAGWQLLLGGLPLTIIAIIFEHDLWPTVIQTVSLKAVLATIEILVFPILFCWFAWFKIVSEVPVAVSAVSIMLVPIVGVYSGHLILDEAIGWREVSGLLLVCSALALVLLPSFKFGKTT